MSEFNFPPRPLDLTYADEFTLRALRLDSGDSPEMSCFVNWVAGACIGENLDNELVKFGYQIDHLICDCNDEKAAIDFARGNLPSLRQHFTLSANELLAFVPELLQTKDSRVKKP